jgi:hypothetical protein
VQHKDNMAAEFLQKLPHGTVYFFRRRVPDDLQAVLGRRQLYKSLCTTCRREAVIRARALAAKTDQDFHHLRAMSKRGKQKQHTISVGYTMSYDPESGVIRLETAPHDTDDDKEKANAAFKDTLRGVLLDHMRGR